MGLTIKNLRNQATLCRKASRADSFWRRAKGLMFQKGWGAFDGLLLSPCGSIHTFGMRMPIDVCFLDSDQKVLKAFSRVGPRRCLQGGRHGRATLELPAGVLEGTETRAGDRLLVEGRQKQAGRDEDERC